MTTVTIFYLFLDLRSIFYIFCISRCMSHYAYQIQGALENANGRLKGLRVLVCDMYCFDSVDIPIEILDKNTTKYLEYRLKLTESMDINKLPVKIQKQIRGPLGIWLDRWVRENFYGDISERKNLNS